MSVALAAAARHIAAWRRDPVLFVRENFHAEPDRWQVKGLLAYVRGNARLVRLALQACAGPGKSTLLAWLGWWTLACMADKNKHPQGAALSCTEDNLKDGLWKELAKWRVVSPFLNKAFVQNDKRIYAKDHKETWFLSARSFAKTADAETQGRSLSGLHAPFMFYLIDESGDMAPAVGRAAEQGLSNCEWGRIATAFNPTSTQGLGHHAVSEQSHLWDVIVITGDPDHPDRSPRIDLGWAREQVKLYGRDNPWVMAFILGLFPPSAINALLGPDEVRISMHRNVPDHAYRNVQKRLGIDVARFGDDRTVIFPRQGLRAFLAAIMRNARTTAIAGRVAAAKAKWGSELELIDNSGGWGAGVIDQCLLGDLVLVPVNSSDAASDPRYFNKRSEMNFLAAEWVKNGGQLPDDPELVREACAATYTFQNGKLRVEEKEQIKKRLGYSPDKWDAFVYTFALPDMPAHVEDIVPRRGNRGKPPKGQVAFEYDPLVGPESYDREAVLA